MSINTYIRYTMSCDNCGSSYYAGKKYADSKKLIFHAKSAGWDVLLSSSGCSYVCICPDCKRKGEVQNEA